MPLSDPQENPTHLPQLEEWLRSYRPEELFDEGGTLLPELQALAPEGQRRMGPTRTPTAGCCCATCACPTSATTPLMCRRPARSTAEDARVLGSFLRDVDPA